MLLSEDELLNLKRRILKSLAECAPLECSEDAIVKASLVAFEHLLEGMPVTEQSADTYVDKPCPTCDEVGSELSDESGNVAVCMSCGERWELDEDVS